MVGWADAGTFVVEWEQAWLGGPGEVDGTGRGDRVRGDTHSGWVELC